MAKILVIEDNPTNLDLMTYLLKAFGHTSLSASEGEAGLAIVHHERPDLIICDIQMPGLNGSEVAKRLKSHPVFQAIPLVAVTAYAMVGDREKTLAAGFDGYITKPIVPETFVRSVEVYLPPAQRSASLPSVPSPVARVSDPTTVEKRATILILDNNAVNRTLICNTLEPAGYQVIEAITVQAAVTVARQALPDLILSDLHLPFEDGYDFIRAVRSDEVLRLIPFVFISSTGYLDKFKPFDRALAPHEFILRPIEPQALIAKIEACLTNVPSPRKRET